MKVRDAASVRRRADGGQERRDRRPDVFAQDERGRRREVDRAERRQRHRDPDRRRRRLNEHRRNAADHDAFERAPKIVRLERLHKFAKRRNIRKRRERGAHRLQAEEDQTDPERAGREVADFFVFRQKINEPGDADERQTVRAEIQRQEPAGRRRPDVRPHHAPDRLRERHQAAVDETENHDRRRGTRLNENRRHKTDADREKTVVREHRNNAAKARARDRLQTVRHPLHPDEEEPEPAQHRRADRPIIRRPALRFERNDGDFRRVVFRRRFDGDFGVADRVRRPVDVKRRSFKARFRDRAAVFGEFERQVFRFQGAVRFEDVLFAKFVQRFGQIERRRRGADENLQVGEPFFLNDILMLVGGFRGVDRFGGSGGDGGGLRRRVGFIVGANRERSRRGGSEERQKGEKRDERGGLQNTRSSTMTCGNAHFRVSPGVGRRVASQNDGAATRSRTKRRSGKNGTPRTGTRSEINVSTDFCCENTAKRGNIETERRRSKRVGSANINKRARFALIISKRRRAATEEERQNGAFDEKRRKRRTKPRNSLGKTAFAPRRRRRRRNVVDVFDRIRDRRTETLDGGG